MKISAIILAAGKGSRMKKDINKQFLEVKGKPILAYTIEAFLNVKEINEIILVVNPLEEERINAIIIESLPNMHETTIRFAYGGKERYDSVYNGLKKIDPECEGVLIHDGARPLVSKNIIMKVIEGLSTQEGCIVGVKAKDTYKIVNENNEIEQTVPRNKLFQIQTPQAFRKNVIIEAYQNGLEKFEGITDDGMMVERFTNYKIGIIEGEYSNIKITTQDDLEVMEGFLKNILKNT